jgi:Ceramidase
VRHLAPALPPGCPWSGFTPPNVDWCEEELCAWITNPADTWSNLLYVVLGLWMWREARRRGSRALAPFGPASIAVGVFSFAYHASYTWLLQFFDFVGMFLFCFCVLALNARRLGWIAARHQTAATLAGVAGASALVPVLFERGIPIQGLVLLLVLAMIAQELRLRRRDGALPAHRLWWAALALLAGAAVFSALDVTRAWCDPRNHWLQGHALWHLLSAASLTAFFCFTEALDLDRAPTR